MKNLPVLLAFLLLPFFSYSQHCGTPLIEALKEKNIPGYKEKKEYLNKFLSDIANQAHVSRITSEEKIYQIPVVVHVIHNTTSGRIGGLKNPNISDQQILSQIDVLNEDFRKKPNTNGFNNDPVGADTKIEFCLATRDPNGNNTTGINRIYYNYKEFHQRDEATMKRLSYWPAEQYLNLWVVDLADLSQGALLGYSHFPFDSDIYIPGIEEFGVEEDLDGVVIDYENFGRQAGLRRNYDLGRTATHEVGHFLGLYHIWGDDECGNDFVSDTPIDKDKNKTGTCTDSSNCGRNPAIYTKDMANNYLDYSYDRCMNIFTQGQKNRMRAVLENVQRRRGLTNSPGCCGGGNIEVGPYVESFETYAEFQKTWSVINPGANNYQKSFPGAYDESPTSFKFTPKGIFTGDTLLTKSYGYLISPYTFFSNSQKPRISFDMAYALSENSDLTDSIVVSYQVNCGNWMPLQTWYGNNLPTTSRKQNQFTPQKSDWKSYEFSIPELGNKKVGRFRIEYYSKNVNNFYVDNLNVYESESKITLIPYPNPTQDELTVKVLFEGEKDLVINIYSAIGNLVYQRDFKGTTSFSLPLDVSMYNSGIYFIQAISGKEKIAERFLKLR